MLQHVVDDLGRDMNQQDILVDDDPLVTGGRGRKLREQVIRQLAFGDARRDVV